MLQIMYMKKQKKIYAINVYFSYPLTFWVSATDVKKRKKKKSIQGTRNADEWSGGQHEPSNMVPL